MEKALDGEGDRLKEYLLGVEVFDRKTSYDPRLEPIVRTEARRLRAKLRTYYQNEGSDDPVWIEFPTGGYAPVFVVRRGRGVPAAGDGRAGARSERPTIAVLPFVNLSADPDNEYFSDGLTEELIHALTQVEGVGVVAWTSTSQFKGKAVDVRQIGRQLKASTVLEGSVRRSGNRLRITAQLINVADGCHAWSERYDREARDVFAIQEEISLAIVEKLRGGLAIEPRRPLVKRYTENLEAHNLYLKGLYHWHQQTEEGLRKSIAYFGEAIAQEPNHAPAHAGVALGYVLLSVWSVAPASEIMAPAVEAAARALEIDETLADAHSALGGVKAQFEWDWAAGEREYRRALELSPGDSRNHLGYAMAVLAPQGRFDEALAEVRLAQQVDPLSLFVSAAAGRGLFAAGRSDEAIEQCRRTLDLEPNYFLAHVFLGEAYEQKKLYPQAISAYAMACALSGSSPLVTADLGRCCAVAGNPIRARHLLAELGELAQHRYVSPLDIAQIHIGLGEKDQAFEWLEKACDDRAGLLTWLNVDPRYSSLHDDSRFDALVGRLGLRPRAPLP